MPWICGKPRDCCSKIDIITTNHHTHALTNVFSRKTEKTSYPSGLLFWSVSVRRHYGIGAKQEGEHALRKARLRRRRRWRHAMQEGEMADGKGGKFFVTTPVVKAYLWSLGRLMWELGLAFLGYGIWGETKSKTWWKILASATEPIGKENFASWFE